MSGPKSGYIAPAESVSVRLERQANRNRSILGHAVKRARETLRHCERDAARLGTRGQQLLMRCEAEYAAVATVLAAMATTGYPTTPSEAERFNDGLEDLLNGEIARFANRLKPIEDRLHADLDSRLRSLERQKNLADELGAFSRSIESSAPLQGEAAGVVDLMKLTAELVESGVLADEGGSSSALCEICETKADRGLLAVCADDVQDRLVDLYRLSLSEALTPPMRASLMDSVSEVRSALLAVAADAGRLGCLDGALRTSDVVINQLRGRVDRMENTYALCVSYRNRIASYGVPLQEIPSLSSFATEEALEDYCDELAAFAKEGAGEAYVSWALSEVMRRHGYDVRRSVLLGEQSIAGHEIYAGNAHGDAGIHVYRGADGTIMMETTSIDPSLAEDADGVRVRRSQAAPGYERMRLVDQQRMFCDLFKTLSHELDELGVHLACTRDMPPSEVSSVVLAALDQERRTSSDERGASRSRRDRRQSLQEMEER